MSEVTVMDVIFIGLKSWALLAFGIGILFVAIVVLNKLTGGKDKK